jgi:hypothetical protein
MTDTRLFKPKFALVAVIAAMVAIPATAQARWIAGTPASPQSQQSSQPATGTCSEVCSAGGYTTAPRGEQGVLPGHQALVALDRVQRLKEQALIANLRSTDGHSNAGLSAHSSPAHPTAAVTLASPSPGSSFDWADAAIGAGIAATVALLLTATSVAVRRRSQARHP